MDYKIHPIYYNFYIFHIYSHMHLYNFVQLAPKYHIQNHA